MSTTTVPKSQYQPSTGITDLPTLLLGNPIAIIIAVIVVIVGFIYKIGTKTEEEEKSK